MRDTTTAKLAWAYCGNPYCAGFHGGYHVHHTEPDGSPCHPDCCVCGDLLFWEREDLEKRDRIIFGVE